MSVTEAFMESNPQSRSHATDARLIRVQAWSGVLFSAFLLLHLMNQMLGALGPDAYDGTQRALRGAYQWAPIEITLVIVPLLVHAGAGIARMVRRRGREKHTPASLRSRLHRWSALVLLVFFVGHVTAVRGASLLYHAYPQFEGIAYTLKWVPAYFWPYYLAFSIAGFYHLVNGLGVALPIVGVDAGRVLRRPRLLGVLTAVAAVALVAGMLGFGGVIAKPHGDPRQSSYAALLRRLGIAHE
jgi:succinate dehydrogenase/fumarate reductase cytochrome b subunit